MLIPRQSIPTNLQRGTRMAKHQRLGRRLRRDRRLLQKLRPLPLSAIPIALSLNRRPLALRQHYLLPLKESVVESLGSNAPIQIVAGSTDTAASETSIVVLGARHPLATALQRHRAPKRLQFSQHRIHLASPFRVPALIQLPALGRPQSLLHLPAPTSLPSQYQHLARMRQQHLLHRHRSRQHQ